MINNTIIEPHFHGNDYTVECGTFHLRYRDGVMVDTYFAHPELPFEENFALFMAEDNKFYEPVDGAVGVDMVEYRMCICPTNYEMEDEDEDGVWWVTYLDPQVAATILNQHTGFEWAVEFNAMEGYVVQVAGMVPKAEWDAVYARLMEVFIKFDEDGQNDLWELLNAGNAFITEEVQEEELV